jgi:hypothetical protein
MTPNRTAIARPIAQLFVASPMPRPSHKPAAAKMIVFFMFLFRLLFTTDVQYFQNEPSKILTDRMVFNFFCALDTKESRMLHGPIKFFHRLQIIFAMIAITGRMLKAISKKDR